MNGGTEATRKRLQLARRFCRCLALSFIAAVTGTHGGAVAAVDPASDAQASVREALDHLIRSIGSNGAEVYLSGIEFAHEQSMSPRVPVQEVPMKQRFILAPDGRYVLQTEEPYPGNVVFRFRTVGSRSGAATFDELMWRTGSEIQRSSAQQAMEDYQSLLLLCPALLAVDAMRHPLTVDTRNAQNGTLNFSYTDSLGQLVSVAVDASSGSIESVTTGNQHYRSLHASKAITVVRIQLGSTWTRLQSKHSRTRISQFPPATRTDRRLWDCIWHRSATVHTESTVHPLDTTRVLLSDATASRCLILR
jgi:hypothetical protein